MLFLTLYLTVTLFLTLTICETIRYDDLNIPDPILDPFPNSILNRNHIPNPNDL